MIGPLCHHLVRWHDSCWVARHWLVRCYSLWLVGSDVTDWLIGCMSISWGSVGWSIGEWWQVWCTVWWHIGWQVAAWIMIWAIKWAVVWWWSVSPAFISPAWWVVWAVSWVRWVWPVSITPSVWGVKTRVEWVSQGQRSCKCKIWSQEIWPFLKVDGCISVWVHSSDNSHKLEVSSGVSSWL